MFSIIIVDYKTLNKTLEYILTCRRHLKTSAEIHYIIVDNDSDTGIEEQKKILPMELRFVCQCDNIPVYYGFWKEQKIYYVKAQNNGGYGRGNNLGAKVSNTLFNDSFLIFSNNDLNFVNEVEIEDVVLPFYQDSKIAALGPQITDLNGNKQNPGLFQSMSQQLFGDYFALLLPKELKREGKDCANSSGVCDWVSGAFMVVDAIKFFEVDGFDENTFLFMEETILSRKFEKVEYYMYYDERLRLIHNHGETVKNTIGVIRGIRHDFQSRVYYYQTYRHVKKVWINLAKVHFQIFLALFSLKKKLGALLRKGQP